MKKTKYEEEQHLFCLKQTESGTSVQEVVRKMGISEQISPIDDCAKFVLNSP